MVMPGTMISTAPPARASYKKRTENAGHEVQYRASNRVRKTPVKRQTRKQSNDTLPSLEAAASCAAPPNELTPQGKNARRGKGQGTPAGSERRARRFRDHPPQTFLAKLDRISKQRMYVVGQKVGGTEDDLEMLFDIVGSTGNLYTVTIKKEPRCNCPDGSQGNFCKHIIYILVFALKAPFHLQYQLAFLSTELCEIYNGSSLKRSQAAQAETRDGNRKPIEGDCPICFMEFEPNEDLVWCKASCGNNIHQTCFQKWSATSTAQHTGVRCVYCRAPWQFGDDPANFDIEAARAQGRPNNDGYVNVAAQFGLSTQRDYSVYSPFSTVHRSYYSG